MIRTALISLTLSLCVGCSTSVVTNSVQPPQPNVNLQPKPPSWSLLDDYQYDASKPSLLKMLSQDNNQNLYMLGSASDSHGVFHWIVRSSSDQGNHWQLSDDFSSGDSSANALCIGTDNSLYVVGSANGWTIRKGSPAAWNTVDHNAFFGAGAEGCVVDGSGNIFAAGYYLDSNTNSGMTHWLVRESTNQGATWNTVDDFLYPTSRYSVAMGMAVGGDGKIYVIGRALDSAMLLHWIARVSADGTTWNTDDDFNYSGGDSAANSIAVSNGSIFVSGVGSDASAVQHWVVRKKTANQWSMEDDFSLVSGKNSGANQLTFDPAGNLYGAGYGIDTDGTAHWIVRKKTNGSWNVLDNYLNTVGEPSEASAVLYSANSLFVGGFGDDANGTSHSLIRVFR